MLYRSIFTATAILASAAFTGCGNAPVKQVQIDEPTPEPVKPEVNYKNFSSETLYALLVAEMAMDRQRFDIALGNYVQQATATRDPNVTEHATRLAHMLRSREDSLQMAQLWVDIEPDNADAHSILASALIQEKRLDEAFEHASYLLEHGETAAFESLAANAAEGDEAQTSALTSKYEQLLKKHPDNTALLVGYSLLLEQAGEFELALEPIERTLQLEPDNIKAAFQESRLLQRLGNEELALEKLGQVVEANPGNRGMRVRYARILVDSDLSKAREQYQILYQQFPFDKDIIFTLALVEKELQLYDDSAEKFNVLLSRKQYIPEANYQLGKIFEAQLRPDKALPHYLNVTSGDTFVASMSSAVKIMMRDSKDFEALELVRENRKNQLGENREGLFMLEADILSNTGQMTAAESALSSGLEEFPDSQSLLYARAMLYTRLDYIEAAERDLKQIITIKPDNAAALNALGYTLADKTDRLDEAHDYITRALAITPNDPAVLDSFGWLQYRKGNVDEALNSLREAMTAMPDHEIAAHLGEVLWIKGIHDEAKKVWKTGLELNPESKIIHQTIHRLDANLD